MQQLRLKLNLDELKLMNDLFLEEPFDIQITSKKLMNKFNIELLAVTKGEDGSTLFYKDEVDDYKTSVIRCC